MSKSFLVLLAYRDMKLGTELRFRNPLLRTNEVFRLKFWWKKASL